MKVLSLFSGVGGFDMGLENAGMQTVFQCEWDKHANSILYKHWPDVPKWDDVSTLTGKHILAHAPVVDVVAWGSPCQDLSVAGKRAGLEGGRSSLFHEGIRIIKELQEETNGQYPRISIWENVVGALNSNRGADFGIILNEMAEAGALAIEWSVLDAQYFGIPQRRRRVFVIAIFDPVLANRCPNPLLPVSESLPGHLAKGKPARKSAARKTTESIGTDGTKLVEGFTSSSFAGYSEGVGTLRSNGGDLGGGSETLVTEPFVKSSRAQTSDDSETWILGEVNPTLNSFDVGDTRATTAIVEPIQMKNNPVKEIVGSLQARVTATNHESIRDGHAIVEEPIFFQAHMSGEARIQEKVMHSLSAMMGTGGNNVPMLAYDEYNDTLNEVHHALRAGTKQSTGVLLGNEVAATLRSGGDGGVPSSRGEHLVAEPTMAVRRLTPLECERLMGWPDDHTRYKADGTDQADTHRYKQCGNGVASPVAQWIAKHILAI
jgi:DNA (cytosine-5)-methyltransferase 1